MPVRPRTVGAEGDRVVIGECPGTGQAGGQLSVLSGRECYPHQACRTSTIQNARSEAGALASPIRVFAISSSGGSDRGSQVAGLGHVSGQVFKIFKVAVA